MRSCGASRSVQCSPLEDVLVMRCCLRPSGMGVMARMKIPESKLRVRWYLGGLEGPAAEEDVHHSLKGDKWKPQVSEVERAFYPVEDSRE